MTENAEPRPNVPLLRKAVEWVEQEARKPAIDREWVQADYVLPPALHALHLVPLGPATERIAMAEQVAPHCGTAFCVAGYIGQLLDDRYQTSDEINEPDDELADSWGDVHVEAFATRALGLTEHQANRLFCGTNTAEDVRRIAEDIAGEAL